MILFMFLDEIHDYQSYVVNNFYLLGNQYSIIKEQFYISNRIIDILAYNSLKECLTIIELKTPQASIKAISQILEYYYLLKDSQLDTYNIVNFPECIIVSPSFSSKIILPETPTITLYQFDNNLCDFQDVSFNFYKSSEKFITTNTSRKLYSIPLHISKLIQQLISKLATYYSLNLLRVEQNNKISFLDYDSKKIVYKIIIPYDWFISSIDLILYNRFHSLNLSTLQYDANIIKILSYKTMIKLTIKGIPNFLN